MLSKIRNYFLWKVQKLKVVKALRRDKKYFYWSIVSFSAIIIVISFIALKWERRRNLKKPTEHVDLNVVKVAVAKMEDFKQTKEIMGTIKGSTENELRFEISGVLSSFNFEVGDFVNKGEVIASLDTGDVMLKLRHAKSKLAAKKNELEAIQKKLEVYKRLYKIGGIIRTKLDEMELERDKIKNEIEALKAEVSLANSELDKAILKSPARGVLADKRAEIGEFVDPSVVIAKLIGTDFVIIEVDVIEKDIEKIKKGQAVKIYVDAYPDEVFRGEVFNISPVVEEESRTFTVKIKVPNTEGRLLSGMYARGEIILKSIQNAILVPRDSVIDLGQMSVLPLVIPDPDKKGFGKIEIRKIKVIYKTKGVAVVGEGLSPGDLVVKESMTTLKDGMLVQIVQE